MQQTKILLAAAVAATLPAGFAAAQTTVTFQEGVNGYNGTLDITVSEDANAELSGAFNDYYFLDGNPTPGGSPDTQKLLRFDGLIGNGPGQIPVGSYITDASLSLTTAPGSFSENSQSGGPFGVARLLQPFNDLTFYSDLPGRS